MNIDTPGSSVDENEIISPIKFKSNLFDARRNSDYQLISKMAGNLFSINPQQMDVQQVPTKTL